MSNYIAADRIAMSIFWISIAKYDIDRNTKDTLRYFRYRTFSSPDLF